MNTLNNRTLIQSVGFSDDKMYEDLKLGKDDKMVELKMRSIDKFMICFTIKLEAS